MLFVPKQKPLNEGESDLKQQGILVKMLLKSQADCFVRRLKQEFKEAEV